MKVLIIQILLLASLASYASDLPTAYEEVMGIFQGGKGDYGITKKKAEALLAMAKKENNTFYMTKTYFLLGHVCAYTDDFGNSVIYYLEGARYAELSENKDLDPTLISIYKNLSLILADYGHYELAYQFINEGLKVATRIKDEKQIISLLNNRIHELIEEEQNEQALAQIDSLMSNFKVSEKRLLILHNLSGAAYDKLHDPQKAIKHYQYVIDHNGSEISPETYSLCLENIGYIHLTEENPSLALDYFSKALEFNIKNKYHQKTLRILQKTGTAYFDLEQYDLSLEYYHRGIELMEKGGFTPTSYEIYDELSAVYAAQGDFESALKYGTLYSQSLEKYLAQQKEIEDLDKKYNIQLLTDRYFDLLAANQEKKAFEKLAKLGIGGTTSLFVIILMIILYRNYRTKRDIQQALRSIEVLSEV